MAGRKKARKIKRPAAKLARTKKELAEEQVDRKKPARVGLAVKIAKSKKKPAKKILHKKEFGSELAPGHRAEKKEKPNRAVRPREIVDMVRIDREKRLIMWSGVTFFMLLVGFFWLYNTKAVFERTKIENKGQEESINWDELAENIGENIEKMKEGLESVKKVSENSILEATTTEEVAGAATRSNEVVSEEKIEALKKKLENISD